MQYVRNPNGTGTAEISLILFSIYLGWPGINNNGAVKMPTSSSVDIDRLIYWSDWRLRYVHQTKLIVTHNTYSCNAEYLRNLTVYIRDIKRRRRIGRIFRATGKILSNDNSSAFHATPPFTSSPKSTSPTTLAAPSSPPATAPRKLSHNTLTVSLPPQVAFLPSHIYDTNHASRLFNFFSFPSGPLNSHSWYQVSTHSDPTSEGLVTPNTS